MVINSAVEKEITPKSALAWAITHDLSTGNGSTESSALELRKAQGGFELITRRPTKKASRTMRKRAAVSAQVGSVRPTSQPSPAVVSTVAAPSPKGRPLSEEAIRLCAYQRWEAAGKPNGDGVHFWLEAERELAQTK